jgi:hypothetical protein
MYSSWKGKEKEKKKTPPPPHEFWVTLCVPEPIFFGGGGDSTVFLCVCIYIDHSAKSKVYLSQECVYNYKLAKTQMGWSLTNQSIVRHKEEQ